MKNKGGIDTMNIKALQILLLCLIIALCGCKAGDKTETEDPVTNNPGTEQNSTPDNDAGQGDNVSGSQTGNSISTGENNEHIVMLKNRKSVSELFDNYGKWAYRGTADGGAYFEDMDTEMIYGFDCNDFEDLQHPVLKGDELINAIGGTFSILYPNIVIPQDKEMYSIFLSVLFGAKFYLEDSEFSEDKGGYSAYVEDSNIFVSVNSEDGMLKPDSPITLIYQAE
jgi:hypothetical protein